MSKARILVIEDDQDINELIRFNLDAEGYEVSQVFNGADAFDVLKKSNFDLIVLDLMLPEIDGKDICKGIRQHDRLKDIPIVMLTAKGEESDVIIGLELGADDYITKPFSPRILLARIKALLRRKSSARIGPQEVRVIEDLQINVPHRRISYRGKNIDLTNIEFNIFNCLSRYPGRVFSRDQIMDEAWDEGKFILDRAVDVHIRSLRKKLGRGSKLIETVRGVGYRFKESE